MARDDNQTLEEMKEYPESVTLTGCDEADAPAIRAAVRRSINRELAMMQEGYVRDGFPFLTALAHTGRSVWYTLRGATLTVFGASDAEALGRADCVFLAYPVGDAMTRARLERKAAGERAAEDAVFRRTCRERYGEWTLSLLDKTLDEACVSMDFSGAADILALHRENHLD